MTTAPERPKAKPRAGRTGFARFAHSLPNVIEWMSENGTICGLCADTRGIWCPDCCGFAGCGNCGFTFKVPCPRCAGGTQEPIRRW